MSVLTVDKIYPKFESAIKWIEDTVTAPKVPKSPRIYESQRILKKELDEFVERGSLLAATSSQEVGKLEAAYIEAMTWIDIHKKFAERSEKEFKDKLRESLFGPDSEDDEKPGDFDLKVSSFGRDIQSELLLASKVKDSSIVGFQGNDIVYDLGKYKFGVECKRIHSEKKMFTNFLKGCKQVQKNASVGYGLVAMRFDKYFMGEKRSKSGLFLPGYELKKRKDIVLRVANEAALGAAMTFQTKTFMTQYWQRLSEIGLPFPKVAGFCAFIYIPSRVGEKIYTGGNAVYNLWRNSDQKRIEAFSMMKDQLEFLPEF